MALILIFQQRPNSLLVRIPWLTIGSTTKPFVDDSIRLRSTKSKHNLQLLLRKHQDQLT